MRAIILRLKKPIALLTIAIMMFTLIPSQLSMGSVSAQNQLQRQVSIPVKVVFVGIDPTTVDLNYVKWPGNLPTTTFGEVFEPPPAGNLTDIVYNVSYTFTFANDAFKSKLESYLQSIQETKSEPNPWFYNYTLEPNGYISTSNFYNLTAVTYDANKVEDWLFSNQQDVGGFPSNGWTLMFMNLADLPSYDFKSYHDFLINQRNLPPNGTAHYYSANYQDSDLGYRLRYRDYMTGWGGIHRFWFNDFSAGPTFWTWPEDIPLQIALADNRIDLGSAYGHTWMTQYVADYIAQATWNFITPFFVYTPTYSQRYSFDVHIFDNRTSEEKQAVAIQSTVDAAKIRSAFQDLVPYSKVDVSVNFEDLSKYPGLENVIRSNYKYTDSFTFGVSGQPLQYGIVDARPVYKYLGEILQQFEPNFHRDNSDFTVPVFAFAFSNDTLFTFTYKWIISKPQSEVTALLGVALGDLALVSLSQQEFERGNFVKPIQPGKGEGFTQVIIHESGHMLGLQHPHNFGPVGDFIVSVMGYYAYDYVFGEIDKDSLQRAHVDQIYLKVQSMVRQLNARDPVSGLSIENQLRGVDSKYSQMDYAGALSLVLQTQTAAESALASGTIGIVLPAMYVVVGIVIGLIVASLLLRRRRGGREPFSKPISAQQPMAAKFCTNCGHPAAPNTLYCHYCGARLLQ
jgi:hypothetical protein